MTTGAQSPPSISPSTRRPITKWRDVGGENAGWVDQNTAILVIHGIGHQKSFETLDQFATGLIHGFGAFRDFGDGGSEISVEHRLRESAISENKVKWYDNHLRLSIEESRFHIDIHEFYWAHETEETCSLADIQHWVGEVTDNAVAAYRTKAPTPGRPAEASQNGLFFYSRNGRLRFRNHTYTFVVSTIGTFLPRIEATMRGLANLLRQIPLAGTLVVNPIEARVRKRMPSILNLVGDIVVYNTHDKKSRFHGVRWKIKDNCFRILRALLLLEEDERHLEDGEDPDWAYGRVVVAGHSLGSQIAYELFNRLNLLISKGDLEQRFDSDGAEWSPGRKQKTGRQADAVASDLITFGSPLDKVAFFLREWSGDFEIRRQIVEHFLCFKPLPSVGKKPDIRVKSDVDLQRLLEDVRWTNYYDRNDYVSGHLDFYEGLDNVDCEFLAPASERSYWWLHLIARPWFRWAARCVCIPLALLAMVRLLDAIWRYFGLKPLFEYQAIVVERADLAWSFLHLPPLPIFLGVVVLASILLPSVLVWRFRKFTHSKYWAPLHSGNPDGDNNMFVDIIKHHLVKST